MSETVIVAFIVSIFAPSILGVIGAFQTSRSKRMDWARQDLVAAKAAEAARTLAAATTAAAAAAATVAERAEQAASTLASSTAASALRAEQAARIMTERTQAITLETATTASLLREARTHAEGVAKVAEAAVRQAEETAVTTASQLRQIHELVNSDMTAARRNQLESLLVVRGMSQKVMSLQKKLGLVPRGSELHEADEVDRKIAELRDILADRLVQQKAVENEQAQQKAVENEQAQQKAVENEQAG